MQAFIGELLGTAILLLLGNGVVAGVLLKNSKSENAGWLVITLGWGLAVIMGVLVSNFASGAHLNPAVTIALATIGSFDWAKVPIYLVAQFLGAAIGATLVYVHYLPHWAKTEDPLLKRAVFCTTPAERHTISSFISEFLSTMVFMICLLGFNNNQFAEGVKPLFVGGLVVAIGLSLGGTTGYAINPARDLAPRIMHYFLPIPNKTDSDWSYSWIPVVAPILGGVVGAILYQYLLVVKF